MVASLHSEFRAALESVDFLSLATMTKDRLSKKRDELKDLPVRVGKGSLVNQYSVEFIVAVRFVITRDRRFLGT